MDTYKLNDSQKPDEHVDIKVDGLMLKVSLKERSWAYGLCVSSPVLMFLLSSPFSW